MAIADDDRTATGTSGGEGSVLGWVVPLLAAYVNEQGHDAAPILHLTGIRGRDLKDPDVRVPEAASREAWRLAMAITGVTMDGAGSLVARRPRGNRCSEGDEPSTTADHALEILAASKTILVVDWVLPEIPEIIATLDANVHAKIGPAEDDWRGSNEPTAGSRSSRPRHRPRRPAAPRPGRSASTSSSGWPAPRRSDVLVPLGSHAAAGAGRQPGCWVPRRQSSRQRATVEASGMAYIDDVYIVDVARRLLAG